MNAEFSKRAMIIVWKWHDLQSVSADPRDYSSDDQNDSKWYDEFRAVEETTQGIKQGPAPALICRLKVRTGEGNEAMPYIHYLTNKYADNGKAAVFVFLHRRDGFTPEHVRRVLEGSGANKCFLFGEGRDRLYYQRNGIGLLGDNGKFMYQPPERGQPEVKVADKEARYIFQPFFDKTWDYYAHEFGVKIFELKEDLLSHFCNIFPIEQTWNQSLFFNYLEQNRLLLLRLKSFINDECYAKLSIPEEEELAQLEVKLKKSYIFDDCKKNLEKVHRIDEDYDKLAEMLCKLFFNKEAKLAESAPIHTHLTALQSSFQDLIDAINNGVEKERT